MTIDPNDPNDAHKFSSGHRAQLFASGICGCFYCLETYPASEIEEWTDDDDTALCPRCGIDSVIGDASGVPISDRAFRVRMNLIWFS